jgi:prepilin-type processing-associated H-X9-DG protein
VKFFPLLWAGLWRKRTRTLLTLLSVVIAFLLFDLLQGVNTWLNNALIGAALGSLAAWLFFDGHVVSTSGGGVALRVAV